MIDRFVVRLLVVTALLLSAQAVSAQQGPGPSPNEVMSQPQFVNGGQELTNAIQSLMSNKSPATLAAIISFAKTANEDQRKAIGQGLAAAAKASAAGGDPGFVNTIQQAVANSGLPELQRSYADAGGDTGTASTGGGGGGGGGGPTAGGPPTGGSNTGNGPNGNTFATTGTSGLTNNSVGGGGFSQVSQTQ
ncbi:MAG TPA: hypothetical protein VGF82_19695 [Terracidiphilus sp.]|jgi:hypothetical protein